MYCKNCGKEMNDIQAVCLNCGVARGAGDSFCPHCAKPTDKTAAFCIYCGKPLKKQQTAAQTEQPSQEKSKKIGGYDKVTLALISIFIGGLGVHNFMLGETNKGLLRLLLTLFVGIGWIFALIDFVKILDGSYKVDKNAFV